MSDNKNKVKKPETRLEKLRRLILLPEQEDIATLNQRLDDRTIRTEEVARVLPEAIVHSSEHDKRLSNALMPTVEEAVKISVAKDISTFADALYPVMGPAIRRSISEAFKEMLQSLNVALENSFSWQGLQWRLESIRTGQAFSEIVMLRSLIYKVDQVFLIHRETGGLLQHVTAIDGVQDADLVSGMFTAITDFVQDSFKVEGKSTLDSIHIDDLTVIIEPGPLAIIAIVIHGSAPKNIREELRNSLELIHLEQREILTNFDGDPSRFEVVRPHLETCLKSQYKEKQQGTFFTPKIAILLIVIVALLGWWMAASYKHNTNWNNHIEQLKQEPGIVITDVNESSGHYSIKGLRDPLARTPQQIRDETVPVAEDNISYDLEAYQALTPQFVEKRAAMVLAIPQQISLTLTDGVLKAEGVATYQWQLEARQLARTIAGVDSYDDSGIINANLNVLNAPSTVTLTLQDGVLTARGKASYQWILDTRLKAASITGIDDYNDSQLVNLDLVSLQAPETVQVMLDNGVLTVAGRADHHWVINTKQAVELIASIEVYDDSALIDIDQTKTDELIQQLSQKIILFNVSSSEQAIEQMKQYAVVDNIQQLQQLANVLGKHMVIDILGHTDATGNYDKNIALSQQRADFIYQYLIDNGIAEASLRAQGVGSSIPVSETDKKLNRSVTFQVNISDL